MSLELSKMAADIFLAQAKAEKDSRRAMLRRELYVAKDHFASYRRSLARASKYEQEAQEWEKVIEDLKGYQPDREMLGDLEEILIDLRNKVSKGTDIPEETNE